MECANQDCSKRKPQGILRKLASNEGILRDNKWYCDEHCYRHPIIKDYLLRKRQGREMRTATFPITARSFGNVLVRLGKIVGYQLEKALEDKSRNGRMPVAHYLMKRGLINRKDVLEALSVIHKVPFIPENKQDVSPELLEMVPLEIAKVGGVFPLNYNRKTNKLSLLMKDPSDLTTIITVRKLAMCNVQAYQGDPIEIDKLRRHYYAEATPQLVLVHQTSNQPAMATI